MAPPRILLVEDNPITRKLVRFVFERERFELSEAADGATAVDLAQSHHPDLILQDLLLPDMDGFELVSRLRQMQGSQQIPILAFSGFLSQFDERRIAASGFTDFVTKPIEPAQLLRIVKAYLPTDAPKTAFGGGRRIVLADDDDVQRKLSVYKLSRLGFDVVDVPSGQAALDAARAHPPDAIVTDAMMPGIDGFGVCAAVRADPVLGRVPIVLVTSTYVDEEDRRLGRLAGADAFAIRTPDHREMIGALELVLAESARKTAAPLLPQDFDRERASRLQVQLDRQMVLAAAARQQCSLLSAELAVLNAISEAITRQEDIDQVLREILAACCDAAGVSLGVLRLTDPSGGTRTVMVGPYAPQEGNASFLDDSAQLREGIASGKVTVVTKSSPIDQQTRSWLEGNGLESALVVPLRHKDRSFGAMVMMSDLVDLSLDNRTTFAEAVGHQVSVALALTTAFEENVAAERRARNQATLLESVFSSISDPIVVVDETGKASAWNAAAQSVLGISNDAGVPQEMGDAWVAHAGLYRTDKATPLTRAELPLVRALRGDAVDKADLYLRNSRRPEGAWLAVGAKPLLDDHGAVRGAVSVSRDVTAEKLAQEQLMIADRMASVGMLAASVGHEINNPLACVVANLEMAAADIKRLSEQGAVELGELPEEINEALDAAQRVRRIARDLKIFSGANDDENGPVDVEAVVDSSIRMAWNQVRHRATVVKNYAKVPPVLGAESRLGQVFLNLIVNAAQAMPEGHADQHQIRVATRLEGDARVVIDVEDTGSGIPPHIMSQLFTPFVTTKPVGVGTGLGLSICQRLVTAMGGRIWAESTPGKGTTFHVELNLASPVAPAAATSAPSHPAAVKASRILVIDDEPVMGTIIARVLRAHQVTSTTNAAEALASIKGGATYDIIFCDLMMPLMTGIEFYEALMVATPHQAAAVVFLTGGAFSKATAAFLESVPNPWLEKPFDVQGLKKLVDSRLSGSPAGPPKKGSA